MTNETQTQIQIFNNDTFGQLRVILFNGEPMFIGKEVALLLGYNDTDQSLRKNVDDEDKVKLKLPTKGGMQNHICINERGLRCLCSKTSKGISFLKAYGFEDKIIIKPRKEYIFGEDIIYNLFDDYIIIPQYSVLGGKYFIDWYIPQLKLAIEFDEDNHKYKLEEDMKRHREIEEHLGCNFIRYKDYRKF